MLEIANHHGEGMGAENGADAVDSIVVFFHVAFKSGVYRFFQGLLACGDGDDVGAQHFHTDDIGVLLGNIHSAHVNVTLQAEVCSGGGKSHTVLAGTGFGNDLLLAHELGKETFTHAVVQLVGTGVVEIFALEINLALAENTAQALAVIHGSRAALKLAADAAQFIDKLRTLADLKIRIVDLLECRNQFGGQECAAVLTEITVLIGEKTLVIHKILV